MDLGQAQGDGERRLKGASLSLRLPAAHHLRQAKCFDVQQQLVILCDQASMHGVQTYRV